MVDIERVERLLDLVERDAHDLREYATASDSLLTDPTTLRAVKYTFVTAAEGVSRVAHHLIVDQRWPVADSSAGAVRELASQGVVDRELGDRLAAAVGFRNILVHQYADVDDRIVVDNLGRVDDFEDFASQVSAWLLRTGDDDAT